ncbi:methylglyoxal synthase [Roseivivax halodurans JCM 10272]|uniref:Methylglyoxal synthase n=1 Tax=Roseivivax halodurans JCM 10272 TaxID=1449350 RepID=X7EI93_9RHOB|nr:methylglyoxal synthase [Roseivivax halodurans]ETX15605.1 methylglyoxal synthase [Roseivivax halodurans JCM 10272]
MTDTGQGARIALVAHDAQKEAIVDWARQNRARLERFEICATGTTGGRLSDEAGLEVHRLLSGPLGGDAQLGAMIAEGRLAALFFFIDPLAAMPHDVDVKSLQRLATLYDIPLALNRATADAVLAHIVGGAD